MDALEMTLLYDFYGELLTERQKMCFELYHDQDLSLAEIAQELKVSRQGVYDNLSRAEAILRNMEEKTGCVRRSLQTRRAVRTILAAVSGLMDSEDASIREQAEQIAAAVRTLEE
ncbi:MAG: HTH domain-containing protein [Ruminococcaceae bacterium]|nr:HTH domain-containing protein [Oscillospiraceae bacterium]